METKCRLGVLLLGGWAFVASLAQAAALTPTQLDRWAKEQAVPPPGRALVYVYRPAMQADSTPSVAVRLDRSSLGRLEQGNFVLVVVDPGRHEVVAGEAPHASRLAFEAEAARVYFVRVSARTEVGKPVVHMQQAPYATGRQEVYRCRIVENGYLSVAGALSASTGMSPAPSARAEPPPQQRRVVESVGPSPGHGPGFALILGGGILGLSSDTQTIVGVGLEFDDQPVMYGGALEWRTATGLALGVELFGYRSDYRSQGGMGGEAQTVVVVGTVKKYVRAAPHVYPYLGLGLGSAAVTLSGPIAGSSSGFALQGIGGVEWLWRRLGFYTQVKWLSARTEDDAGQEVDMSGRGIFAGLTLRF